MFASLRQRLAQWVFQPQRHESSPIVLTQRRCFILPTRTGFLFALVLLVMLIGAINYDLSLGHALVFLLAGLGLVSMVHAINNLLALRIYPGRVDPVFAGQSAQFFFALDSVSDKKSHTALDVSFADEQAVRINVPIKTTPSFSVPCLAAQRGRLKPGRLTLASRYPLGLFRAWAYLYPPLSCLVYPQPIFTPLPAPMPASQAGVLGGQGGQEDFSGLREWQPNESTRHIAWKAVAHDIEHRPLLTKTFSGGASEELWLDWHLLPTNTPTETRLSMLCGWVLTAAQSSADGLRYGLRLPHKEIALGSGSTQQAICLEALAVYETRL